EDVGDGRGVACGNVYGGAFGVEEVLRGVIVVVALGDALHFLEAAGHRRRNDQGVRRRWRDVRGAVFARPVDVIVAVDVDGLQRNEGLPVAQTIARRVGANDGHACDRSVE